MPLLDPDFADAIETLFDDALGAGVIDAIEIVSGWRDSRQQARLYADYRAGRSSLPAAAPGTSFHEFGLAVDVAVSPPEALADFGLFAESRGFRWGGRFDDPVHVDAGNDFTLGAAKARFKTLGRKGLVEVS